MFLVCDKITHLCKLLFSYDQENNTLPTDFLGVLKSCYSGTPTFDTAMFRKICMVSVCVKGETGIERFTYARYQQSQQLHKGINIKPCKLFHYYYAMKEIRDYIWAGFVFVTVWRLLKGWRKNHIQSEKSLPTITYRHLPNCQIGKAFRKNSIVTAYVMGW